MKGKSLTGDELSHLPAGYSYITTGLIKLNPQHPPLIKQLCAIPLLFLDPKPPLEPEALEKVQLRPGFEWEYGEKFLFSQDADRLLFWGRVPAVMLSLGLATLVMVWASRLWGASGGLLALVLYAFDPTITAHAQFVTTDVGLAFFATLFLFAFRSYLEEPSRSRLLVSGLTLGLALGAKFSAVILIPIAFLLGFLAAWHGQASDASNKTRKTPGTANRSKSKMAAIGFAGIESRPKRIAAALGAGCLIIFISGITVWAIYFFPADPLFYIRGFQAVNRDHIPSYEFYLMGEFQPGGWRSYFTIAWLVKTPIPSLILLGLSVLFFLRGRRASWLDEAFLVVPAIAFFTGYSLGADNLGVRYLIPCFPFFFIFASRIASNLAAEKRGLKIAVVILSVWYVAEFIAISPDHLSYFNQIAGGYRGGTRWLDDSNVDWGQGLIQLREYLQKHPARDFWLCDLGAVNPAYYGIQSEVRSYNLPVSPPPGRTLILSAHCVARWRAILAKNPEITRNWLVEVAPKAIVGHALYIYEMPRAVSEKNLP
ncbi:MAG: glycosyltransferase family 39 protein [Deltaproteobacteria bacterium]|nr:glycosyltransferase family 39 protein [Deltaproteobacteria bacterium]